MFLTVNWNCTTIKIGFCIFKKWSFLKKKRLLLMFIDTVWNTGFQTLVHSRIFTILHSEFYFQPNLITTVAQNVFTCDFLVAFFHSPNFITLVLYILFSGKFHSDDFYFFSSSSISFAYIDDILLIVFPWLLREVVGARKIKKLSTKERWRWRKKGEEEKKIVLRQTEGRGDVMGGAKMRVVNSFEGGLSLECWIWLYDGPNLPQITLLGLDSSADANSWIRVSSRDNTLTGLVRRPLTFPTWKQSAACIMLEPRNNYWPG